jgi:PAS domain S-box-containing protein
LEKNSRKFPFIREKRGFNAVAPGAVAGRRVSSNGRSRRAVSGRPAGPTFINFSSRSRFHRGGIIVVVRRRSPGARDRGVGRRDGSVIALIAVVGAAALVGLALLLHLLVRNTTSLRQSEARFRDFALISSDFFWETDENHRYTYAAQSDGTPENRLGRTRLDCALDLALEPEKWREHQAVLDRHEEFHDFVYTTTAVGRPDTIVVSVNGSPVFDDAGRFRGYRGTACDITEKVRAEVRLREAKAAAEGASLSKSHFLANMSHEVRTPLNAILGFSRLLEDGVARPLQHQEYARFIRESGEHLLHVLNGLLDLARIEAGKLELDEEAGIDPRHLCEQCTRLVDDQAKTAGLSLSVAIADDAPLLRADRTRLIQVLLNLLSNAIKFTEPAGAVILSAGRHASGEAVFEVRDTGVGMTAAEIAIALEPFAQIDAGLDRKRDGAGLGLPLARRLVELHGGSLVIDSRKAAGTTVTVVLPASRVMPALPLEAVQTLS